MKKTSGTTITLTQCLSWVCLMLIGCLWAPTAWAQQVTRVGNILTITPSGSALATIPEEANGAIDVAVTDYASFALMPNGTVVAWGSDNYGLVSDAKFVRRAKKIAAGRSHALALLENGTLYSWGENRDNVHQFTQTIENAVDVVASFGGSGALKADGEAMIWGNFPGVAPLRFTGIRKLEMLPGRFGENNPIAVFYKHNGTIEFHSNMNLSGQMLANLPSDSRDFISVAAINDQYIGIRKNSTLATWIRKDGASWNLESIQQKADVHRIITGNNSILVLKNSGVLDSIGWLDWGGGNVGEMLSSYQSSHPTEVMRFQSAAIGVGHFIGILANGISGPIVKQSAGTLIVEAGQRLEVGPQVLLGESYQWSRVDGSGQLQPLIPPSNAQQDRLFQVNSVGASDSGIYINTISGNGKSVNTDPLAIMVREVGSPNIVIDGETIYYPNVSSVRRAGSAKVRLSTSITGSDRVFYSLDGSEPAFWKPGQLYTGEITVTETSTLKVVVYTNEDLTQTVYSPPIEISIEPSYSINLSQAVGGRVVVSPLKSGYFSGETVRLVAYADPGYRFVSWSGGVATEATLDLSVTGNLNIQPIFETVPSFSVTGVQSLNEGWTIRVVKPKQSRMISGLSDAEGVLNTNPDDLGQSETKTERQVDFITAGTDGWPSNPTSPNLPASKWEDGAVLESIGYIEVLSPSVYTLMIRSFGTHVMTIAGKTVTGGSESGTSDWVEQIVRFDKPGYYPVRIVHWDNSSNKRLVLRVLKGTSYDNDRYWLWVRSPAANLGDSQYGGPRVFSDLGYSISGVGKVELDPPGNRYYAGASVRLTAVPETGWQFMGWRGDISGSDPVLNYTIDKETRLTPVFGRTLSIRANTLQGAGTITTIPSGPVFEYNSLVTLKAESSVLSPSYFIRWSPNDKLGSFNYTQVKIDRFPPPSITGFFGNPASLADTDYVLGIRSIGRGRVISTPATGLPRNVFRAGDKVRLVAEAYEDSVFDHWEVDGTIVGTASVELTMSASKTVVAHFLEGLHVMAAAASNGEIRIVPQKAGYRAGETIQVMAIPVDGYLLNRWADLDSRETVRTLTLSGDPGSTLTMGATFVAGVRITTSVAGRGTIASVPTGPIFYPGTSVTLTARPDYRSRFVNWDGLANQVGEKNLVLNENTIVQAVFENEPNVPVFGSLVHWGRTDWGISSVPSGSDFVQVSAGNNHVVALKVDGTVVAWGNPNGGENVTTVPTGLVEVQQVSGGNSYSLALKKDGTVVHWGGNRGGNMPSDAAAVKDGMAIVSGASGAVVLRTDGTVVGLGQANTIQNKGWRDIVQIAGVPNQDIFLGLTRQGNVVAYHSGQNDWVGRLNIPAGLRDVVQVALSERTAFAVKADGSVVAWGSDDWGLKGLANSLTGIQRIEAGLYHFLAINQSGVMTSYGDSWAVVPSSASRPSQATASQQFSVAIIPVAGLAPEIVGNESNAIQLEVGDELIIGLGLEGRNVSRWQWQNAVETGGNTVWEPISGQTSRRLRIASVVSGDTGRYRVVAFNDIGSYVGPEVSLAVVPAGTPLISVNGIVVSGLPSETVKVRVGDAAVVRVSSRMANPQIRYTQGGAAPTFSSVTYSDSAPVELLVGNHRFRAGAFREGDATLLQSLTLDIEVVPTYSVVTSVGQGEGLISVNPSKARYLQGDIVTLTAAPAAGFEFAGWGGINASTSEVSLTLGQNLSPMAKFAVRPSYRITGIDAPSQAGWKVVRVVDTTAKPVTITSDISAALTALAKSSAEAQFYSEIAPFISYRGKNPTDNWYEVNRVFPGGSQASDSAQPKYALRAFGFVEIPNPGTYTFGAVFSGPFRLRVGDTEWSSGWDTWRDGRMGELKFPRAGVYPIELVQWDENPDNSQILLFAKAGPLPAYSNNDVGRFVQEGARFVGDVDRGGLRVWTELPNLSVSTVGTVTGSTGYGVFAGETVTLRAEPAAGWTFVRWEGDVSGTSPTITVTPMKNIQVKPIYSTPLQLSVVGDESGNVHGRLLAVPSQSAYEYGTEVRLEAVADTGYGFEVFLGNVSAVSGKTIAPATFRVDRGSPAVTARFKALAVDEISVMVNSVNGGYVQISPSKNIFKSGDSVTLTAVPAEGYLLDAWDGAASAGRTLTRTITIQSEAGSAQTVGASFVAGVRLNTSVEGRGSVTVTPSAALYYAGTPVTAKATPAYGARFVRWDGVGEGETDRSVALTSTSSLKAVFENMADVPVVGSLVYWGRSDSPIASVPTGFDFVQVSIGNNHALALKVDGTVVAWGNANGNNNVTTVPAGLSGVKKVAAGKVQSLALKIDGTVAYWGRTDWNLPSGAAGIRDAVDIAAGDSGSIVLKADGTVVGIGQAVEIQWRDIVKIAAYPRQNIFLGLKRDGAVLAYSRDNDWANRTTVPQGLKDVVDIALSEQSAYAVKRDGTVVVWGNDWGGVKAHVPTLTGVNRIVGGWYHLLIESSSGTITTFGDAPWNTPMPAGASTSFGGTAGEQASIGIVPVTGLAPEVAGNEPASIQLEVGDELVLGLGLETRNGSRWQWQKASGSGESTVWTPIAGQTSRRFRNASVGSGDSGRYRLVASNDNGSDVGPEISVSVVPSGTPQISVNGVAVNGMPGETVRLKVGDRARVALSTRLEGGEIYYSTDGDDVTVASFEYTLTTDLDLGVGSYGIRAGVDAGSGGALVKGVALELEVVPTFAVTSQVATGEGAVELSPNKARYLQGEVVGVVAKAAAGFEFAGWDGVSGAGATTEVQVSKDLTIGARFRTLPIFRITGTESPSQAGWKVTRLVSAGSGTNSMASGMASAIAAFSLPSSSVQSFSETAAFINYRGRNPGNWMQENRAYPGGSQAEGSTQVPFVVKASGYVEIPEPGSWTFGVVFSGPFRLKVGDSEWQGGWETWQDGRMSVIQIPRAGIYPIELLQWDQNPNEASLLLFARRGGLPAYDSDVGRFYNEGARFVGDVDRGGLRVWSELPGLDVTGVGRVTGSSGFSVIAGQSVQLTAEPSTGWTFVRWSGDVSGTDPVLSLTPTSDLRIKPIFATTVALSVPNGNGTLAAIPASGPYEYGSKVRLQATPQTGFGFQRFTVNIPGLTGMNLTPTEITVNRPAIQVAASFVSLTATTPGFVALDLGTPSGGLVTVTPAKNLFNPGAAVSAKAVADPGWFFTGWESPVVSTQSQVQFFLPNTAGSVSEVRAKFVEGVALKALVSGRGRVVSNPPEAIHFPGSTVQLVAEAASGARFVRWQAAETLENPTAPNLSLVMSQEREVTAVFENDVNSREFGRLVGNGTSLAQSQVLPAGDDFVQVSLGAYHALALRLNGTVEAWGDNRFGQVTVPTGLSGVRSVVAGINYSLALKEDGSVVGWGQGVQGINLGILPRDITSMVAGASHVVFLRSNGVAVPIQLVGATRLISYWDFESLEPDGQTVRSADGKFLGTIKGSAKLTGADGGRPGGGRGFDVSQLNNSRGHLLVQTDGNSNPLNSAAQGDAVTVMLWQKNFTYLESSSFWMVATSQDRAMQAHIPWSNGSVYFDNSGCCSVPSQRLEKALPLNFTTNQWHHFTFVKNKGAKLVYLDGDLLVEQMEGADPLPTDITQLIIGSDRNLGSPSAVLDDFAVFNGALTPSQILSIAKGGSLAAYQGLSGDLSTVGTEGVSQLAANLSTTALLFLNRNGTVVGYPEREPNGQTTIPTGINDFVQVALSRTGAYGLRSNGKVVVWGTVDAQVKTAIEALPKVVSMTASGSQIWLYNEAGQVISFMDDGNQPSQLLGAQGARIKSPQFQGVTALGVAPYSGFSPHVSGFTSSEFAVETGGKLFLGTGLVPESGSSLIWEASSSGLEGTWVPLPSESLTQTGLPVFDPITQAATGFYRWTARNGAGSLVGSPIRVVSRPAGSPVLLVDGVPYEQSGSAGVKVFGSSTVAVRSSASEQTWKVNLGGTLAPVNLKSGEAYSLGLGSFTVSAEATVGGVDLKSVELPLSVVPIFEVKTASGLIGGTFQLEVVDSEYTVPQATGYRVGAGATVRATAAPAYGYRIKSWKGFTGEVSTALSFTVNSDRVVEPEFEAIPTFALTIIDGVDRGGSIFGVQPTLSELNATGNRLLQGSAVTLRADPRPGFVFKGWKIGGTPPMTSVENPLTLTVNADVSVEALFETTIAIQSGLAGGSIQSDLSSSVVTAGATGFFYAVPEVGKYLANWSIQGVVQNQIQVSQSFGYGGDTSRPLAPARFDRASYRDTFQWTYDDLPGGATTGSPAMTVELSGVFYPPANSFYQFKIQSEGFGELWISPDVKPENLVRVAADGDNFPTVGMSSVAGDIAGLSTTSPRLSLKSGQGYYIRARLFKMAGQAGSVALTQGASVLGDSMNWETDPMSAANFRLPTTGSGPVLRGSTALLVADRPYQVSAVFSDLPTDWTSLRAVDSAGVSVYLTPSVALVGLGQIVKATAEVKPGLYFDRWLRPLGLSEGDVTRASIEVIAGNDPLVFEPRIVPEMPLLTVRSGQDANKTLEEGNLYSVALDRLQTDSRIDIQVVEGPAALTVVENSDKSFGVSWPTTEADGPSNMRVQLRARLRSESGEVLGIQMIDLRVEVLEVNFTPRLAGTVSETEPVVVSAGSTVEVSFEADDVDLPIQNLEALIVEGPDGGQIHLNQEGLRKGGKLTFRWPASEGLGDRIEKVTLAIRDSERLQSTRSFFVKVPAVTPRLTVVTPEGGPVIDERITISGSASDNSGSVSVKLLRDGAFVANLPITGGVYTYRLADRLTNSVTRFTVVASDASGNTTQVERTLDWAPLRRPILGTLGSVKDGQELVVPLGLETPGDVSGMAFALTYDPTYLKSPQVTFKNSLPGAVVLANVDKPGEIRITLSSASGKTLPGGVADLADISFRARSVPDTVQTQIRAAIEDTSDARGRAHAFGNGNAVAPVEIRRRTYVADNNGNDLIDVGDAYLIQRKLVRLDPTEPWDVAQNDLNASDSIDSGDVTSVLRIVVDLDPVQTLAGANSIPASGPSAMLSRVVASGSLGGVSVEKRSAGFRIASGIALGKSRTGVLTLRHSPAWVITQKSISVVGQGTGGALVSVATHLRDGQAFTKVSYLLSKEASSEGIVLEIQPDQGLELGGSVSLRQWSYSRNGFDLINATVEQTELEFFVIPSVVESVSLVKTSDGFHLNLRGIPNVDYSIQASSDLLRWQEIQRHTANGEFQQLPVKADGLEAGFYRSVRAVANPAVSNK